MGCMVFFRAKIGEENRNAEPYKKRNLPREGRAYYNFKPKFQSVTLSKVMFFLRLESAPNTRL